MAQVSLTTKLLAERTIMAQHGGYMEPSGGAGAVRRMIVDISTAWRIYAPSWRKHGGALPCTLFLATFLLLPSLPVLAAIDHSLIEPVTRASDGMFSVPPKKVRDSVYYWTLFGVLANTASIGVAICAIANNDGSNKTDRWISIGYTVIFALSLFVLAFIRWTADYVIHMLYVYYFIYATSDLIGIRRHYGKPYELAKYTYPFVCLDLPALITSLSIALSSADAHFLNGMAAGHLLFGSFCYFGIAGIILPFALNRIARAESARVAVSRAASALEKRRKAIGYITHAGALLNIEVSEDMAKENVFQPRTLAIVLMCAALNAGLAFLVQSFKLPIYLDLCGSILCAVLLGLRPALLSAALGILVIGTITVPTNFAYIGTALGVTALAWYLLRFGYLERFWPTLVGGLALGLLSAVMSAPVTAIVFGGVSLVGADAVTALIRTTGANILTSVFLGGIATDPVDKVLTSFVAYSIYKSLPASLRPNPAQPKPKA